MALSARTPTTADTNLFVPKLYCQRVIDAAKSELVAWDAISSEWRNDLVKGNILYIPKTNTVTASEVVVGTKGTALNPMNTTGVTLTIDQWFQAPVDIDYMTLKQTQVDAEEIATTEAAYAIKVKMDSTVCALFSSLGGYSTSAYGTDGQVLTDDILLYLKETLDEANVPMVTADRSLICDPSALVDILKIDKLVAADYVKIGAVENGIIGNSVYGCVVRVTNNLTAASTGSYGVMLHKKAIASAAQIDTAWVKEYEDLHQRRYHSEALWGVVEAQDTFGIPFFTRKA
jgi:hypothetical protein